MTEIATPARPGRPRADGGPGGRAHAEILAASAALFAERGYAGTTTRAIAEQVGIRQASLYYHFAGKDEILLELLETSVRPSLEFVARLADRTEPAGALWALLVTDVATLIATPFNIGSLYLAHEVQEPRFDTFREHRAELQGAYVGLVEALGCEDAAFVGACCMQLVEMIIPMRRDDTLVEGIAESIAAACIRLAGGDPEAARAAAADLLSRVGPVDRAPVAVRPRDREKSGA